MRVSVKTKQIIAVTAIVFSVVALMGVFYLQSIAAMLLQEARTRADLLASAIFTRAAELALDGGDLRKTLAEDAGLRSILKMSYQSEQGMYAAIVDPDDIAITHSDAALIGTKITSHPELSTVVDASPIQRLRAIYTRGGLSREVRLPLMLGTTEFGEIRVAVSTLLIRDDLETALRPAAATAVLLLIGSVMVATLLAQWTLRPILLIRAGLARLGRGETGVTLALPQDDEFAELGQSFNEISARLAHDKVEGQISRASVSRRLAALGRVSSGIAHEVKNPLNAMRIHLELLKMQLDDSQPVQEHVSILARQMRRLDEVVQGFLSFARPDPLTLAPVSLHAVIQEMLPVVRAEAGKTGVQVQVDCPEDLPPVLGDAGQLQQAFLNLALNACQAMPQGGRLRLVGRKADAGNIEVLVDDTGTGIAPGDLDKIFNLYFTTKAEGSGVGLALVYRTIHLHDGDIDVQSVPGEGTTFRVTLPAQA
jgi:signal transduction histidine kinase